MSDSRKSICLLPTPRSRSERYVSALCVYVCVALRCVYVRVFIHASVDINIYIYIPETYTHHTKKVKTCVYSVAFKAICK
jgi:hypothetical protein